MKEGRRYWRVGRLAAFLAIALNVVPLQPAWLDTALGPAETVAAPAGIPDSAPSKIDLTPAQCTAFFRRWRSGENNDEYMVACTESMGINRWCAEHDSKPYPTYAGSITGDPAGNRRALICVPNPDDDDALAQVTKIANGVADAFIQAAPYLSLASQGLACANGAIFACATFALDIAGTAGVDLPDVAPDKLRDAIVAAKRISNCTDGDVVACSQLGLSSARAAGLEIPGVDPEAIAGFTGGCADGDIADCIRLGNAATQAAGIPTGLSVPGLNVPDYPGAASAIADQAEACADGSVAACAQLGAKGANAFFGLKRPDPNLSQAAAQVDKCSDGDFGACFNIGRSAADALGLNVPPIVKDAQDCAASGTKCAELGLAVARSVDLPAGQIQDQVSKANQCRQGNTAACAELAKSAGVPLGKIAAGYQNADRCKQQDQAACLSLGKAVAAAVMNGEVGPAGEMGEIEGDPRLPVPQITTSESGETWIFIVYNPEPGAYQYNRYEVNYQLKAGIRGEQGPIKNDIVTQAQGAVTNHTIANLEAGKEYGVAVRGCDFTAVDGGRLLGCSQWSEEKVLRTKATQTGSLVSATITASPGTATPGSTVQVNGLGFQPGTVEISLSGPNGGVVLSRAVATGGRVSSTVTIPANTAPGTYKLRAADENKRQLSPDIDLEIVAAGGSGILTVIYNGLTGNDVEVSDNHYVIQGVNFTPGPIELWLSDAPGGAYPLGKATVGSNGRFSVQSISFPLYALGARKITAVQNGTVRGELAVVLLPKSSGPR